MFWVTWKTNDGFVGLSVRGRALICHSLLLYTCIELNTYNDVTDAREYNNSMVVLNKMCFTSSYPWPHSFYTEKKEKYVKIWSGG